MDTLSVRDMLEARIAGERDPRRLAGLARGAMKAKHAALVEALTGRFDDHHAELARMLLDQIDTLNAQIARLTTRIDDLLVTIIDERSDPVPSDDQDAARDESGLTTIERLDEIPGVGRAAAQIILAEVGPDMTVFPRPRTWCRGRNCARAPSSPGRSSAAAEPARATPTSRECSARPPPQPPRQTPSSANATGE
ncbi:probable transposase [Rhodococcus jostii RHA1]|jgi:transposase|uniref:Probable transposase n=1 Tax=Rhodococcus jostii (strain RHA1) TaxID=101510 RepID=Q0S1A3_RHOJR|nr:probable transposase [Rhodococcus jostii RHA1]